MSRSSIKSMVGLLLRQFQRPPLAVPELPCPCRGPRPICGVNGLALGARAACDFARRFADNHAQSLQSNPCLQPLSMSRPSTPCSREQAGQTCLARPRWFRALSAHRRRQTHRHCLGSRRRPERGPFDELRARSDRASATSAAPHSEPAARLAAGR